MAEVVLSKRLQALACMVTPGRRVVDVGCDHGFVSIYLVQRGISPRVLAMDVRMGPLSRAKEHIAEAGLGGYIETRLSQYRRRRAGQFAWIAGKMNTWKHGSVILTLPKITARL